ncbi:hypothetical protein BC939DRAFT_505177 [Gamsiella multidivaricata]|uniref:uncharacterized protein n=1 Tax=Gamsiella multidivaricata TaxID=101098 RepID=UPI00221ECB7F|nr:uncharacterized protein BC939DRAFT_505177 [Gamsiella multidivaricata]KAG0369359.1 Cysteine-rich protein 2-binding protein [Gamsiella multidivaricata]KAI7820118.1 hypothetical protein BC939DRAFT_505177 [Gamsiella multidivaricata]
MAAHTSRRGGKTVMELPYKLGDLHWAADHKSNEEGIYCYCGRNKASDEPMLPCQRCGQLFHSGCVSCLTRPLLKGDEFFKFECSVCTQGPEFFERAALSWVILVHLVLYNLMDTHPEQQYFRWKEEICKFIDDYWSYLLPDKEQSPTWNNTVASVLSVQNHIFLSGVETKGASGWWTLIEKAPPDRNRKLKPKNKASQKPGTPRVTGQKNKEKKTRAKGTPLKKKTKFDETSSDDDFHTSAKPRPQSSAPTTRIKNRQFSLSSGSSLSSAGDSDDSLDDDNFWKSDDEKEIRPLVHLHGIPACIHHHFNPSGLDFSGGPIHLEEIFRLTDLIDERSPGRLIHRVNSLGKMSIGGKKKKRRSSAGLSADSGAFSRSDPTTESFSSNDTTANPTPILKLQLSPADAAPKPPPALTLQQLQRQQEWHILQVIEDASKTKALPTVAARFKRKLHLKRLKAFLHLPLFDMEGYMRQHLTSPLDLTPLSKHIPPDPYELRRLREEQFRENIQKIDHTPYGNSFASRLLGQPAECQTQKPWEPLWKSSFSGKVLKDFIWRDYESRSVMMDVLDEIKMRQGRPAKVPWANLGVEGLQGQLAKKRRREESPDFGQANADQQDWDAQKQDRQRLIESRAPIDYCYFRKEHLAQVNETLCRRFWPGIDMTEALQYPEYSVVVLYKRLVVGCAFMTPEGYITYVAVSAGWEKAGIGQFMLYHLMQASEGKDITLHVSANNPAMIMYQKFGFKPEQFLINFYKEYLPQNSLMCHNAFFVRLRR